MSTEEDRKRENGFERLPSYCLTEKNTFLNLDPPLTDTAGGNFFFRRPTSAPASRSHSSTEHSSSSLSSSAHTSSSLSARMDQLLQSKAGSAPPTPDDEADGEDDEESGPGESGVEGAEKLAARQSRGSKSKRPCKSRRNRHRAFLIRAEGKLRENPDVDIRQLVPPSFVRGDEQQLAKLHQRLEQYRQDVRAGKVPRDLPDEGGQPIQTPAAAAPSASSSWCPSASSGQQPPTCGQRPTGAGEQGRGRAQRPRPGQSSGSGAKMSL